MSIGLLPISWKFLRLHALFQAVCLADTSGEGARIIVAWLRKGLSGNDDLVSQSWLKELDQLEAQVADLTGAITEHDLKRLPKLKKINQLRKTLEKLGRDTADVLSKRFADHVLKSASKSRQVDLEFVNGLLQIAKNRLLGQGDSDNKQSWHRVWPNLLRLEPIPAVSPEDSGTQLAKFCNAFNKSLKQDVLLATVCLNLQRVQHIAAKDAETDSTQSDEVENRPFIDGVVEAEPAEPITPQKDGIEPQDAASWHDLLSTKVKFSTTSHRLGLNRWDGLPQEHVRAICAGLASTLQARTDPYQKEAVLLLLSLMTGAPIRRVLTISLRPGAEVFIDSRRGTLTYQKSMLLASNKAPNGLADQLIEVPLPQLVQQKLEHWSPREQKETIGAILTAHGSTTEVENLRERAERLLKRLGDEHLLAWPGKWASSGASTFLQVTQNDLVASVCTMSPQLSAPGAMHYFHPSSFLIQEACRSVYESLGLGPPVSLPSACESNGHTRELPTTQQLNDGFSNLVDGFYGAVANCRRTHVTEELIDNFNQATKTCGSLIVFLHGGRGSRIDRMTFGSMYGHADVLHLHDKDIESYRGSRLIAKTGFVKQILNDYLATLQRVAQRLVRIVAHNDKKTWRELSELILRFDACAFQLLALEEGSVRRTPMEAADVEETANKYFDQPKNFARHVLVTHWVQSKFDRNLLRAVTGHTHDRLDFPSSMGTYAPWQAIEKTREPLEQIQAVWLSKCAIGQAARPDYRFASLSLRRLQKLHATRTEGVSHNETGCSLDHWHFVAIDAVDRIRHSLLTDRSEVLGAAKLLLYLLFFDLLHHEKDLHEVWTKLQTPGATDNSVVHWRREGEQASCTLLIQIPTQLLLKQRIPNEVPVSYKAACEQAQSWLASVLSGDKRFVGDAEQTSLLTNIRTAVHMWSDLHIPGALQYHFNPQSHSAQIDVQSLAQLWSGHMGDEASSPALVLKEKKINAGLGEEAMKGVLDALNSAADRKRNIGGTKRRYNEYCYRVSQGVIEPDTWADVVDRSIRHEIEALIAGRSSAIEMSSMATYLSALRIHLGAPPDRAPSEMRDLDFLEFATQLKRYSHVPRDPAANEQRAAQQANAAHWLLRKLADVGMAVPHELTKGRVRTMHAKRASVIVHASDRGIRQLLASVDQELFRTDLNRLRAEVAILLLTSVPLRSGELFTLRTTDLSALGDYLILRESGFAHIKSTSSWRYVPVPKPIAAKLRKLIERVNALSKTPSTEQYLFIELSQDEKTLSSSEWLSDWIRDAVAAYTGCPNFRVHALRAGSACEVIYPEWEKLLKEWRQGLVGPKNLADYFRFAASDSWRLESAREALGHSRSTTSIQYYFYSGAIMRSLAAGATLMRYVPTQRQCEMLGVSEHALRKAMQRDARIQRDPWLYLASKLGDSARHGMTQSEGAGAGVTESMTASPPPIMDPKTAAKYVGLRLLGVAVTTAQDQCKLSTVQGALVEQVVSSIDAETIRSLRKRQKGTSDGRAEAADQRLYESSAFERLYTHWKELDALQRRNLRSFLTGIGGSDWRVRLEGALSSAVRPCNLEATIVLNRTVAVSKLVLELEQVKAIRAVSTVRDQSAHPRIFIFPTGVKPNKVLMSRWLSVARVVLAAIEVSEQKLAR